MSTVIKVENLSKQYRLGLIGSGTLREDLEGWWYRIRGKEDPTLKIGEENDRTKVGISNYVWALKDIDFEVKQGEVLGIIGKNGAGKSTLLKLLSQVTAPTTGSIKAKGRIASLLEVGTGFHPELTGRENIFLNGAIMGMKRHEIKSKLDEIVAFAGVERYLETPVKRYSSGMYVRLAFAVAAHLEPEILIVDEVLAVGDAEFQKKALGKMKDVSQGQGRTVLFVSHNMASVQSLCSSGILLENGKISYENDAELVVSRYLKSDKIDLSPGIKRFSRDELNKDVGVVIDYLSISSPSNSGNSIIQYDDAIDISICLKKEFEDSLGIVIRFKDEVGNYLFVSDNHSVAKQQSVNVFECSTVRIPSCFFNEGCFFIDLLLSRNSKKIFEEMDIMSFTINPEKKELGSWMKKTKGPLRPKLVWHHSNHYS